MLRYFLIPQHLLQNLSFYLPAFDFPRITATALKPFLHFVYAFTDKNAFHANFFVEYNDIGILPDANFTFI